MWGDHLTHFKNGFSGVGKTKVNSNNEIIPELPFQQKRFQGGVAKRFDVYNNVTIENEPEQQIIKREKKGIGYIYIHGRSTSYYEGKLTYNIGLGKFKSEFYSSKIPVFSDCVIFKRISTAKDQVGRVYGSTGKDTIRDYDPAVIANGYIFIKRFEYQSITKSSLDQKTAYRRDKNYYSKVFQELWTIGRPDDFEKKLCCKTCGQYYYTGYLKPAEDSPCYVLQDNRTSAVVGMFYTLDDKKREVTNPQHSQYFKTENIENLINYDIIRFKDLDVTAYDYDYRILYYPEYYFGAAYINYYQGSLAGKRCSARYGLTESNEPVKVNEYSKKNDFWYASYAYFMLNVCNYNSNWVEKPNPTVKIKSKIKQTETHREDYRWEAVDWHSSKGTSYMNDGSFGSFTFPSGSKIKNIIAYFYDDDTKDVYKKKCSYGLGSYGVNAGGAPHATMSSSPISTTASYGHLIKGPTDVSLEVAEFTTTFGDIGTRPQGSYISNPENSQSLSEDELEENGITPKNESETTEEEETSMNYGGLVDPFEITHVWNMAGKSLIKLQMYMPHVLLNRLEYQDIPMDEERLSENSTESNLDYVTIKLLQKNEDGSADTSGEGGGYVKVNDEDFVNNYENAYYLKQAYKTALCTIYKEDEKGKVYKDTYEGSFYAGSEKVYYKDESTEIRPGDNYFKKSELPESMKHSRRKFNRIVPDDSGRQYKDIQQRLCASYGKYSFLAVGNRTGWAQSVFNKYIFLNMLPDKDKIYDEGEDDTDSGELDKMNLLGDVPPLLRSLTEADLEQLEKDYEERINRYNVTFRMNWTYKIGSCPSYIKGWGEWGPSGWCYGEGGDIIRASRNVSVQYPWKLLRSRTVNGITYNTYGIDPKRGSNNIAEDAWADAEATLDANPYTTFNDMYGNGHLSEINNELKKYKYTEEVSPVWKNANLPGAYLLTFSNLNKVGSSYAEYRLYMTKTKGKLLYGYNASYSILRPWAGSIVTAAGCCPSRAKNDYFIFDGLRTDREGNEKKPWAPSENLPPAQNRFYGSGVTYLNFLGEGIYPHPDGNKFICVSAWFTDAYEGLAGIELTLNKDFTDFADRKCSAGFSQSCDTALITTYNIAGPLLSTHNIFVHDVDSYKYPVNKGVFPIIKALWQPKKDTAIYKNIENALFMIETQCMIEGPEYFYSRSESTVPPGFETSFKAYKSRGLMVAIKYRGSDEYKNFVVDEDDFIGFFDYFKPQNEKREKINVRKAYDSSPQNMREKSGWYWECEEAFGLYEISSPFTFETQLAAKMSFSVRVGNNSAVLFLLAYDIDKWPGNVKSDTPTHDKQFPKIYEIEEYSFKSAYLTVTFNGNNGVKPDGRFKNFVMEKCLHPLTSKKSKSDRAMKKLGKSYFKVRSKVYPGIIIPTSYVGKTGSELLPQYVLDDNQTNNLKVRRGVVRLVRTRNMTWIDSDNKTIEGAVAQCALSYKNPFNESIDQYYVGETILLCFYKPAGSYSCSVRNIHIPQQMVWLEETGEIQDGGGNITYNFKEHLIDIVSCGMIDNIIIEKKVTKKNNKEEQEELFEVLAIPVITSSNDTYLAVSRDCGLNWEIAGYVGHGDMQQLVAEFVENKQDG